MREIFSVIRLIAIIIYTLVLYILYISVTAPLLLFRFPFEHTRNFCMNYWGKGMMAILNVDLKVKGTPPEPPFFLVSNHLSYLDIIVLNSILKTTFIAKSEVKNWPVVGFMARTMGIIFIDRTRRSDVKRVNTILSAKMSERQGVILFPEGKTSAGSTILPFKASLLHHPAIEGIPVSYVTVCYETGKNDPPAYQTVNWWKDIPFYKHMYLLAKNSSVRATLTFGDRAIHKPDRKELAQELHEEVLKIFRPMVSEETIYQES